MQAAAVAADVMALVHRYIRVHRGAGNRREQVSASTLPIYGAPVVSAVYAVPRGSTVFPAFPCVFSRRFPCFDKRRPR